MILKHGSKGADVEALQLRLNKLGFDCGVVDGDFGGGTETAVKAWELSAHVQGVIDDDDWALMSPLPARKAGHDVPQGQQQLLDLYGEPWHDPMAWLYKWCTRANIGLAFDHILKPKTVASVRGCWIWVNRDIVEDVEAVFAEIITDGLADKVESFDGCFSPRRVRGTTDKWSTHTWAVALDLNAATNGLGVEPAIDPGIVRIFKAHGWIWGGDFRRLDGMHFQRVTGM